VVVVVVAVVEVVLVVVVVVVDVVVVVVVEVVVVVVVEVVAVVVVVIVVVLFACVTSEIRMVTNLAVSLARVSARADEAVVVPVFPVEEAALILTGKACQGQTL